MNYVEELQRRLTAGNGQTIPPVICTDGFIMSVQANKYIYCEPKNDVGPWVTVEVGFPNRIEPLLFHYAESPYDWKNTVYPYVPIELVAAVIEVHGGIKG